MIYWSPYKNPYAHGALESLLAGRGEPCLLLWTNPPTVAYGRNQILWMEVHVEEALKRDILLFRRRSGGGAVYHDAGNLNYSFIGDLDDERDFAILCSALDALGVPNERTERGDIRVDGKKVSGSAYRRSRDGSYHHGTLLVSVALDDLHDLLHPPAWGVEASSGVASVRSPVRNIDSYGVTLEGAVGAIADAYARYHKIPGRGSELIETLPEELWTEALMSKETRMLQAKDWIYWTGPRFIQRVAIPGGEVVLTIYKGRIEQAILEPSGVSLPNYEDLAWDSKEIAELTLYAPAIAQEP